MYYLRTAPAASVSLSALNTFFAVFTHSNLHLFIQRKQLPTADVFNASPLCFNQSCLKENISYFLISQFASKPSGHPLSSVSVPVICSRRQPKPFRPDNLCPISISSEDQRLFWNVHVRCCSPIDSITIYVNRRFTSY